MSRKGIVEAREQYGKLAYANAVLEGLWTGMAAAGGDGRAILAVKRVQQDIRTEMANLVRRFSTETVEGAA